MPRVAVSTVINSSSFTDEIFSLDHGIKTYKIYAVNIKKVHNIGKYVYNKYKTMFERYKPVVKSNIIISII